MKKRLSDERSSCFMKATGNLNLPLASVLQYSTPTINDIIFLFFYFCKIVTKLEKKIQINTIFYFFSQIIPFLRRKNTKSYSFRNLFSTVF